LPELQAQLQSSRSFTPDITPLILASHKDNYEIIKILLDRGAQIPEPVSFAYLKHFFQPDAILNGFSSSTMSDATATIASRPAKKTVYAIQSPA
jgi:hypothetical protein